jgi:hypothetical protein
MSAGLPKYVTVNLSEIEKAFEAGATVDLQTVQDKKLLNISGRETKLPLKVRVNRPGHPSGDDAAAQVQNRLYCWLPRHAHMLLY